MHNLLVSRSNEDKDFDAWCNDTASQEGLRAMQE